MYNIGRACVKSRFPRFGAPIPLVDSFLHDIGPTMSTMVHAPLSEKQNFLPIIHGFFGFGFIVKMWGFPGASGLSRPHALAALSKNPLGSHHRGSRGYARGSVSPSEIGPNGARPGF